MITDNGWHIGATKLAHFFDAGSATSRCGQVWSRGASCRVSLRPAAATDTQCQVCDDIVNNGARTHHTAAGRLAREKEAQRRATIRIQCLANELDEAERGGASVIRIDRVRTLMDLPPVRYEVAS